MTEADDTVTEARGSIPATVAIFALAGPALATVVLVPMALWRQIMAAPEFLGMIPMLLPTAYLVGLAPALLTGVIATALSRRIANPWIWMGLTALAGAALVVVAAIVLDPTGGALNLFGTARLAGIPSAVAFLLCGLACWGLKLRPR